jgi:hypothetical protein
MYGIRVGEALVASPVCIVVQRKGGNPQGSIKRRQTRMSAPPSVPTVGALASVTGKSATVSGVWYNEFLEAASDKGHMGSEHAENSIQTSCGRPSVLAVWFEFGLLLYCDILWSERLGLALV